eukprot:TRINITY_DN3099_c0_g1_i1.p1 TRINITY_DN3099_c0_g1~~TRINITY_DN3099_c0_g1_i1.p1  ORF type:complete len:361 (+),score=108.54 TRINITY_DN3099_c0_g1_i1:39-1085(+)
MALSTACLPLSVVPPPRTPDVYSDPEDHLDSPDHPLSEDLGPPEDTWLEDRDVEILAHTPAEDDYPSFDDMGLADDALQLFRGFAHGRIIPDVHDVDGLGPEDEDDAEAGAGDADDVEEHHEDADSDLAAALQRRLDQEDLRAMQGRWRRANLPGAVDSDADSGAEVEEDDFLQDAGATDLDPHFPTDRHARLMTQVAWYVNHILRDTAADAVSADAVQQLLHVLRDHDDTFDFSALQEEDLDVDAMSYEQLLALQSRIGVVARGVDAADLARHTVEWRLRPEEIPGFLVSGFDQCRICHDDYEAEETLRRLRCTHAFHGPCIDRWLSEHRACPLCKQEVVPSAPPSR